MSEKARKRQKHYVRGKKTRKRIMAISRRVFIESGYDDVALTDLSLKASVAYATIYTYFANKDHILTSIIDEELKEVYYNCPIPAILESTGQARELHYNYIHSLLSTINANHDIFTVYQAACRKSAQLREHCCEMLCLITGWNTALLRCAEENDLLRINDIETHSRAVTYMIKGFYAESRTR